MANVLNQRTLTLDAEGIISVEPIWVRKVVIFPNSAGNSAKFTYWDLAASADTTQTGKTVTVTSGTDFLSTGNFESSEITVNDIFIITDTSTGNNLFTLHVKTRTDDDNIIIDALNSYHGTITNEASKVYSWEMRTPYTAFTIISPDAEAISWEIDFGDEGKFFPNLAMNTLSGSTTLELFIL